MDRVQLIEKYGEIIEELKKENIIRTRNVVGEIGEYYAINYFNKTKGLPKLQSTLISTKNIDAVSNLGERYSIKTTTGNITGAFLGLKDKNELMLQEKVFEYVLIVILNNQYQLKSILQIDWKTFLQVRHWNNRVKAWNLRINKDLRNKAKIIYQ